MKRRILELMVQAPTTQLPNHIKYSEILLFVLFIVKSLCEAIEAFFVKKNYHEFDPHVGETSCQIRAYQILLMAINLNSEDRVNAERKINLLRLAQNKLDTDIPHFKKIDSTRRDRNSKMVILENFLNEHEYNIEMTEKEFFLIQARILTKYKKIGLNGEPEIDYERIMKDLSISKQMARRIVHLYQINLAELSCQFIFDLLNDSNCSAGIKQSELAALMQKDDDKRLVLPCFWVMKAILDSMLKQGTMVLVLVNREYKGRLIDKLTMQFYLSNNHCNLMSDAFDLNFPDLPCYVLEGVVKCEKLGGENQKQFKNRFLQAGLLKVILANMAAHPQYSGHKFAILNNNLFGALDIQEKIKNYRRLEKEILFAKEEAKMLGCGMDQPKLFYIIHIFCDSLNRQLKLSKQMPHCFSHKQLKYANSEVKAQNEFVKEPSLFLNA